MDELKKYWEKFKNLRRWKQVVIGFFIIGAIGTAFGGSSEPIEATQKDSAKKVVEKPMTETQKLQAALEKVLGKDTNRGVPTIRNVVIDKVGVIVEVNGEDNLTEGMVKTGARLQLSKIIKVVQASGIELTQLRAVVWYTFVDNLGQEQDRPAVAYGISSGVLSKINTDNIMTDELDNAPDLYADIHPAFQF